MPKSKHRRKPGGKSVARPGRRKASRSKLVQAETWSPQPGWATDPARWTPEERIFPDEGALSEFLDDVEYDVERVLGPSHPTAAMARLVFDRLMDKRPVTRSQVTDAFLAGWVYEPIPGDKDEDGLLGPPRSQQEADEAWSWFIERQIVAADGDLIRLHPRFEAPGSAPAAG